MRRVGGLFDRVVSLESLYAAYLRARRGKRSRESVDRFSFGLERELLLLRTELRSGEYRPGAFVVFEILDPKLRTIHAAPFRDRVLHHAIIAEMEPHLERSFDGDSCACRRHKGMDVALRRAVELARRSRWVLKADIERCFPSIDHRVLKEMLRRRFKDRRLLELLGRIIDHGGSGRRGLPIGSLTSQWFANVYLDRLDRFVRQALRPAGYLRYMDDFVLFGGDREWLRAKRVELRSWLAEELRIRLKDRVTQIHSTARGWPFLGFSVSRGGLRIRRVTWGRLQRRMGATYHEYRRGRVSLQELVRSVECRVAHMRRAPTDGLRLKEMRMTEL